MRPSATPPTNPHLRPWRVEWSVAFWISSSPSVSRFTTMTPSISKLRPSSTDLSASYACQAMEASAKSATKSV